MLAEEHLEKLVEAYLFSVDLGTYNGRGIILFIETAI